MGTWGAALYSDDLAADLKSTIAALARLPLPPERLVQLLRESEPGVADDATDPDHTVFWLVVADQFAKRGLGCEAVTQKALAIIDSGADIEMMRARGMSERDIDSRRKVLSTVRESITGAPGKTIARKVLRRPQPYLFDVGELLVYPTMNGDPINAHVGPKDNELYQQIYNWKQDGWTAILIVERGREFDLLAWYRRIRCARVFDGKPALADFSDEDGWTLEAPGTLSKLHMQRMRMESIGRLPMDHAKLERRFPHRESPRHAALMDLGLMDDDFRLNRDPVTGMPRVATTDDFRLERDPVTGMPRVERIHPDQMQGEAHRTPFRGLRDLLGPTGRPDPG